MNSVLKSLSQLNTTFLLTAVLVSVAAEIVLVLMFQVASRAWQHFRIRRFDALSFKIHGRWRKIVRGEIAAEEWRNNSLQCEIVQSIVIQEIGAATDKDRAGLQKFLRASGLLNRCIERVHSGQGWSRRRAMLALGAMRVPEAIAPISEALDDWQMDTRIAAVRALGRTGLPQAAEPILEMHMVGGLKVPTGPVANALVRCYMNEPEALLPFLRRSLGESRELLARVASELATPRMADEMVLLAEDPGPEIRACAAKALANAPLPVAIPALAKLVRDDAWFVRLRAASSLNQITHPRAIPALLEAVRDPNRMVRMRAATALAKFENETLEILQRIIDSRDRYALHAMISALDLGGRFEKITAQLADPMLSGESGSLLLDALHEGAAGLWTTRPADSVVESVFP